MTSNLSLGCREWRYVHLTLLFLLCSAAIGLKAQRTCGTMEADSLAEIKYPAYKLNKARIQNKILQRERDIKNGIFRPQALYTIPVVFHILYKENNENIPDEVINSQIEALNRDFNLLNTDISIVPAEFRGAAANVGITFCLAGTMPNGAPTSGVERRQSNVDTFYQNQNNAKFYSAGGLDAWDATRYLNIWVCRQLKPAPNSGTNLLGYATFPGQPAQIDGVVIVTGGFGDKTIANYPLIINAYNRGRTAVHEVGHWLNLRHIWGDANCGNDGIDDTPIHDDANYGCPAYPLNSNCGGTAHNQMTMNYMDYTNDDCLQLFTEGQKTRAIATLTSVRISLFILQPFCTSSYIITPQNAVNGANYKASDFISSTDEIISGESNTYKAGIRVSLKPGFKAKSGSYLRIKNGECCIQ